MAVVVKTVLVSHARDWVNSPPILVFFWWLDWDVHLVVALRTPLVFPWFRACMFPVAFRVPCAGLPIPTATVWVWHLSGSQRKGKAGSDPRGLWSGGFAFPQAAPWLGIEWPNEPQGVPSGDLELALRWMPRNTSDWNWRQMSINFGFRTS